MNKKMHPRDIATTLLRRSTCAVQVAAVLADSYGVSAWSWNHMGFDGMGMHAEHFCIKRSNPDRWWKSTMWVAARRKRNGKTVTAKPCSECQKLIKYVRKVMYRDKKGEWRKL